MPVYSINPTFSQDSCCTCFLSIPTLSSSRYKYHSVYTAPFGFTKATTSSVLLDLNSEFLVQLFLKMCRSKSHYMTCRPSLCSVSFPSRLDNTMRTSRKTVFAVTALRLSSSRSVFGRSQRFFGPLRPLALGCGFTSINAPSRSRNNVFDSRYLLQHVPI
jgi:hypothetical protein